MKLFLIGCLLFSHSILQAAELFSEGFEMIPTGPIYGASGWYADPPLVGGEQDQYAVVKNDSSSAAAGSQYLELSGGSFPSNTFYRLDGVDADSSHNNQVEFQVKRLENAGGALVFKIFADKGSTEVVRFVIQPTGEVLVRGSSGELEKVGASIQQDDWTKMVLRIAVGDKKVSLDVKGATDSELKSVTVPFVRGESEAKLSLWAAAFSIDEAPGSRWMIDEFKVSDAGNQQAAIK